MHSKKTNQAEQEVADIMGGVILEFSAKKYCDAGRKEGREEGEQKFGNLTNGETGEAARAVNIKEYRDSL